VRLLVERGARLDIRDTIWQGTLLGWALYGGGKTQAEMAECLRVARRSGVGIALFVPPSRARHPCSERERHLKLRAVRIRLRSRGV
jgi:hypothetical protein